MKIIPNRILRYSRLTREVYRWELIDLDETFQIGISDNGNHVDDIKIEKIGIRSREIGENPQFFTCTYVFTKFAYMFDQRICSFLAQTTSEIWL